MGRIRFTADITHNAPTATAPLTNLVHSDAETVARWHTTAHDRSAIRTHDHAVIGPARRCEIEGTEEKRDAGGYAGQYPGGMAGPRPADRRVGRDDERKRKEHEQGRRRV